MGVIEAVSVIGYTSMPSDLRNTECFCMTF